MICDISDKAMYHAVTYNTASSTHGREVDKEHGRGQEGHRRRGERVSRKVSTVYLFNFYMWDFVGRRG